jgi:osmotically-inducible protein OsmY
MASNAEKIKTRIQDALKSSPDLKAGNYISVSAKRDGLPIFGKFHLELTGRAASDKDKAKIEEIAKSLAEGLEITSYVRTGRAG